jgi:hypothetical protein
VRDNYAEGERASCWRSRPRTSPSTRGCGAARGHATEGNGSPRAPHSPFPAPRSRAPSLSLSPRPVSRQRSRSAQTATWLGREPPKPHSFAITSRICNQSAIRRIPTHQCPKYPSSSSNPPFAPKPHHIHLLPDRKKTRIIPATALESRKPKSGPTPNHDVIPDELAPT